MKKSYYYSFMIFWLIGLAVSAFVFNISKEILIYAYIIGQGLLVAFMPGIYKYKKSSCTKG